MIRTPRLPSTIPTFERGPNVRRRTELGLLIYVSMTVALLYVVASLGARSHIPLHIWPFLGIILALSLAAHVGNRWLAPNASPIFLPVVFLLNGIGYVVIARWEPANAKVQAAWTALGIAVYLVTLLLLRRSRDLERYRYILLLLGGLLLVSPLVPAIGRDINGARLWVGVGSLTVQPIEGSKLLLCIYFASYFTSNKEMLSVPTARVGNRLFIDPRPLVPILVAWLASMAIIGAEKDVAFALLLFTLFIGLLWIATGRLGYLIAGLGLFAGGAELAGRFLTQVHERVLIWLNAGQYASGHGYQLVQSWYALAAGGIGGVGLGRGESGRYLHRYIVSDFIFTGIGEELGLIGAVAIVTSYVLIVGSGLRAAQTARSEFSKLLASGLTMLIGFQAFFVMAGILRLLPLTGITLPFVAFGGSSLLANYVLIAMVMRISDEAGRSPLEEIDADSTPLMVSPGRGQ